MHVRPGGKQRPDRLFIAATAGAVESRPAAAAGRVHVGTTGKQLPDQARLPLAEGPRQQWFALIAEVRVRAPAHEVEDRVRLPRADRGTQGTDGRTGRAHLVEGLG